MKTRRPLEWEMGKLAPNTSFALRTMSSLVVFLLFRMPSLSADWAGLGDGAGAEVGISVWVLLWRGILQLVRLV